MAAVLRPRAGAAITPVTFRPRAFPKTADSSVSMPLLKLIALDPEDLAVISANVQDAVLKAGDILYQPKSRRLVLALNRFDWEGALANAAQGGRAGHERRRSALRFERVLRVRSQNLDQAARDRVLSLLTIAFEPAEPPAGQVTLIFAGNAALRLDVECIEVELRDLGARWKTRNQPDHSKPAGGASKPKDPAKTS